MLARADPDILKKKGMGALYVSHHGWSTKKVLGFRWSKKAKITLETISFWRNISISFFKFSPFLYTIKACQRNINLVMNITQKRRLIKINYKENLVACSSARKT